MQTPSKQSKSAWSFSPLIDHIETLMTLLRRKLNSKLHENFGTWYSFHCKTQIESRFSAQTSLKWHTETRSCTDMSEVTHTNTKMHRHPRSDTQKHEFRAVRSSSRHARWRARLPVYMMAEVTETRKHAHTMHDQSMYTDMHIKLRAHTHTTVFSAKKIVEEYCHTTVASQQESLYNRYVTVRFLV